MYFNSINKEENNYRSHYGNKDEIIYEFKQKLKEYSKLLFYKNQIAAHDKYKWDDPIIKENFKKHTVCKYCFKKFDKSNDKNEKVLHHNHYTGFKI